MFRTMKPSKTVSQLVAASGWLSSVLPGVWAAMLTSAGGTLLLLLTTGAKFVTNAEFIGAVFFFTLMLWTYIGIVWLATRKPRDVKALRHGITFEGINPAFNPNNPDVALQFALMFRNYNPVPIRFIVEEFDVRIGTRVLPAKYQKNSLQTVLARGAGRSSAFIPFKFEHLQEFMGKQVEGTLDFCVQYGDADKQPVRKLRMSIQLFLVFPSIPETLPNVSNGILQMMFPLGFGSNILAETDDPLDS